jgi:hypothetical protein
MSKTNKLGIPTKIKKNNKKLIKLYIRKKNHNILEFGKYFFAVKFNISFINNNIYFKLKNTNLKIKIYKYVKLYHKQ